MGKRTEYFREYRRKNKEALNKNTKSYYERQTTNGHYVYYLPEEHYVGMTNYLKRRMHQHRKNGRCTEGMEIVACFERGVDAHYLETLLHMRGYDGFTHQLYG